MWIDRHPYILIYLLGSALVVVLVVVRVTLLGFIAWITKSNVIAKNLKKLDPPDDEGLGQKALTFVVILAFMAAISWIGVAIEVFQIIVALLQILRDAFTSAPEAIKLLRFPLRNNPDMSREAVWAYVQAMRVRSGEKQPDENELLYSLNSLREEHPSFNREAALSQLEGLGVVSSDEISSALQHLTWTGEEISWKGEET